MQTSTQSSLLRRFFHAKTPIAFTLVELLAVIAIIFVLAVLAVPAFNSLKSSGGITNAAYEVSNTLQQARSYSMANNTYVWVGFFEENVDQPTVAGKGRIVMSVVTSKDGTKVYPGSDNGGSVVNPTKLSQLGKLIKLENTHLATFARGTGDGETFDKRPMAGLTIGENTPSATQTKFQYPVGSPAPSAQYTFVQTLQFSPRGEIRMSDNSIPIQNTLEIALQPTKGNIVVPDSNVAAIQITGFAGNVKVYQR